MINSVFNFKKLIKIGIIIFFVLLLQMQYAQETQKGKIDLTLSGIPLISWQNGYYGFALKPGLGFYLTENLSIQNDFFYHIQSGYYINSVEARSNTIGFIPSLRYNFFSINRKWCFSVQAGAGFGVTFYKPINGKSSDYQLDSYNSGIVVYSAGVGVVYQAGRVIGIEMLVPYVYVDNVTNKYNADILFNGLGPTVGLKINLN